jgi:hypothetical protein
VYSDEVWTGVEYQVAANLIYEGRVTEGLMLVAALRDRHDGYRRNPWNEVECGHHYARSTAAWALIPALTGFQCDVDRKMLRFSPALESAGNSYKTIFTCGAGWGIFAPPAVAGELPTLTVLGGSLEGFTLEAGGRSWRILAGRPTLA